MHANGVSRINQARIPSIQRSRQDIVAWQIQQRGAAMMSRGPQKAAWAAAGLLLTAAPFSAAGVFGSSGNVPDWVKAAAQAAPASFPGKPKTAVLLSEITYTVAPNGQAVEHVRRVVKILRPQGRDDATPAVWFDKDSKIMSMHVWSIDPAGHEYAVKDSEILEVGAPGESGVLYSDDKAKTADPPGMDPGGVVAYEYERRERPYLAETSWFFQDDEPRVNQSFTLVLPPGFTYTTTWAHHPAVDGADLENHSYRWEMNNEAAIDLEQVPMSPRTSALAGRMTVHYTGPGLAEPQDGTWQGIGEWYNTLENGRLTATPEIAAKATELTTGKTDFYDKAEAVGEFVQKQIRYYDIEMGVGGYQPHPAADIFKDRYGDCKDKATLLSAMLSSVGIHSALLMVHTERGVIDPDAPSILGNHMIGAIEIPEGYQSAKMHSVVTAKTGKRYLIFDPTWDQTPFGQLEDNLQGSYGVLMEGDDSQIVELPVMSPDLNTIVRTASFRLSADGSLKGSVTDKRYGDVAEDRREVFGHAEVKKQQEYMDHVVARDLMAATVTGLKVDNVSALNQALTTNFDLDATHYASATGPLLMVRPRVLGSYELDVDHKIRKVAIDLHETMQASDDFDIQIPDGYVVDEVPDPVKEDVGFASYESSTVVRGQVLHYSRRFVVKQVTLPPEKYPELQRLAAVIAEDEDSKAVLKRAQ